MNQIARFIALCAGSGITLGWLLALRSSRRDDAAVRSFDDSDFLY